MLRFDDRVAIVTGAGRGIGLAHAELLAARGAKIVINDLGSQMNGGDHDFSLAEQAMRRITAAGAKALADSNDVSAPPGAEALVQAAITHFGGVDIVINNAGIFDNDAFPADELDELMRFLGVHVGGSFNVTRAAWPALIESGAGRVIMTTSTSALGAGDTVIYGTAKAGVLGLGRALAQAGAEHGIKVNMLAPMALTRMMRSGMERRGVSAENERAMREGLVSPLLAVLAHEDCPVSGETFMSGMRRYSRLFIAETEGYVHETDELTPEQILEHWDEITNEEDAAAVGDTWAWSARNTAALQARPLT